MPKLIQKSILISIAAILCTLTVTSYFVYKDYYELARCVSGGENNYIKWVDFDITSAALNEAMKYDIETYPTDKHVDWISILALYAAKNGGNFSKYKTGALLSIKNSILEKGVEECSSKYKLYGYYYKAYSAVLLGMLGEYTENETEKYGLRAFSPIASGYYYTHFDDFGSSRNYGYKRKHLGHDILGSIGTPIIAVESGYVEACGWNQYGGWRIGIRSFDGKRYYYYAHLRSNHPYNDMYEGKIVTAGDVIGYLGMTGYSSKEGANNIKVPHLHIGLQLIFDKSQKDGYNQIWIDMYELTKFLYQNKMKVVKNSNTNEYDPAKIITIPDMPD